jgi:RNA polymerase sigma factor (sigma-70 family)
MVIATFGTHAQKKRILWPFLHGTKMFKHSFIPQGKAYQHPLWKEFLPNSLSSGEIKELVISKDHKGLIFAHGRRALHIAGAYIATGGDIDEMVSAAMFGLVEAVNKMMLPTFDNVNPSGYIASYVHQHCFGERRKDVTIPVPRNVDKIHTWTLLDTEDRDADFDIIEFYEIMEIIADSEFEKEVINFRAAGCSDSEIADKFNVSRSTVSRTRKSLYERYCNHVK